MVDNKVFCESAMGCGMHSKLESLQMLVVLLTDSALTKIQFRIVIWLTQLERLQPSFQGPCHHFSTFIIHCTFCTTHAFRGFAPVRDSSQAFRRCCKQH